MLVPAFEAAALYPFSTLPTGPSGSMEWEHRAITSFTAAWPRETLPAARAALTSLGA